MSCARVPCLLLLIPCAVENEFFRLGSNAWRIAHACAGSFQTSPTRLETVAQGSQNPGWDWEAGGAQTHGVAGVQNPPAAPLQSAAGEPWASQTFSLCAGICGLPAQGHPRKTRAALGYGLKPRWACPEDSFSTAHGMSPCRPGGRAESLVWHRHLGAWRNLATVR